jgi:hypothetical protein
MKIAIAILGMMSIMAGLSSAQPTSGINAYAGGGATFPFNDLNTFWENGYHGTVGVGFRLTPGLEGVARYAFHTFPAEEDVILPEGLADISEDFDINEYGIDIRANLAAPGLGFRPYGLVGAGIAKMPDKSEFFYSIGGGFKVSAIPRLNFFLEGRYMRVSVNDFEFSYAPVTVGLNLSL